nr:MAG TPA: hypothetical protein [Caudoviricetes sp.]
MQCTWVYTYYFHNLFLFIFVAKLRTIFLTNKLF